MMTDLRAIDGRFVSPHCPDPNCGGELVRDDGEAWLDGPREPILRCNGLTHHTDDGPLVACPYSIPASKSGETA